MREVILTINMRIILASLKHLLILLLRMYQEEKLDKIHEGNKVYQDEKLDEIHDIHTNMVIVFDKVVDVATIDIRSRRNQLTAEILLVTG